MEATRARKGWSVLRQGLESYRKKRSSRVLKIQNTRDSVERSWMERGWGQIVKALECKKKRAVGSFLGNKEP